MTPLDHLINYSSELAQRPSFFAKNVASRFVTAVSIPFELLAILENTIKLPFQTAATIVKIPAKIVNVFVDSMSLKEFESSLASPLDVITTAFKIAGFAIGLLFTATLGLLSPHKNFRLHCSLGLVNNHHAQKLARLEKENKQKEIEAHEKIIEDRLKAILNAMRQQPAPVTLLTQEQRHEIELMTKVPCPSIEDIVIPSTVENTNIIEETHNAITQPDLEQNPVTISPEITASENNEILPEEITPVLESELEPEAGEEIADDLPQSVFPFEDDLDTDNEITQVVEDQEFTPHEGNELVKAG